jgi:hypothetical protein
VTVTFGIPRLLRIEVWPNGLGFVTRWFWVSLYWHMIPWTYYIVSERQFGRKGVLRPLVFKIVAADKPPTRPDWVFRRPHPFW